MTGYAYILNGKPVVNPEKRPESECGCTPCILAYEWQLRTWEQNCIEIENAHFEDEWLIWLRDGHDDYAGWPFNKEQRLEYTPSNGKAVVTKIQ